MTKADILTEVRKRTGRGTSITDIDAEIDAVLKDITTTHTFLSTSKSFTLTADISGYNIKTAIGITGLKYVLSITDDDDKLLDEAENLEVFLRKSRTESSGTPNLWLVYDGKLLLYPTPDEAIAITIYYSFIHPVVGTDDIQLPDNFKDCIIEGVCYEVFRGLSQAERGRAHQLEYFSKLHKLIMAWPEEMTKTRYRDV